jgi:uncharacterized protein (DUF427 family)
MQPQRIEPGPGQESVWDYPRPPAIVPSTEHVRVVHRGVVVAETRHAIRVLETSQPPAYYLPRADVRTDLLSRTASRTVCEWKGAATYWSLDVGDGLVAADVAWSYEHPVERFAAITGHLAFYPQRVDEWRGAERRGLLRRLGHVEGRRPVQGCTGHVPLVTRRYFTYSATTSIVCASPAGTAT